MNKLAIASAVMAFACLTLAIFFLNSTGFSMQSLLLFDLYSIKDLLLSPEFWLFVLFFSLANGLFLFIFEQFERKLALASAIIASALAVGLSFALFEVMQKLVVVFAFYMIGLIVAEEFVKMRLTELKRLRAWRAASAGMGKVIVIMALGLFITGVLIVMPQQERYWEQVNEVLVKTLLKAGTGTTADAMVASQRYLMQNILNSKQFMAIRSSSSPEDQNFALYMGILANKIFSKEYRENAAKQVEKTLEDKKAIGNVMSKMPFADLLKKLIFVLLPLNSTLMFWFFGQVIIKNISSIIAALVAATQRT